MAKPRKNRPTNDGRAHKPAGLNEYDDMLARVEQLKKLLAENLGDEHPVRQLFEGALPDGALEGDTLPPIGGLRAALAAFDAQSTTVRRRLLNDWEPDEKGHPTRETVMEDYAIQEFRRCLTIRAGDIGGLARAEFTYEPDDCTVPVRLVVHEATRKREVLLALQELYRMVETEWDRLVIDPRAVRMESSLGALTS